MYFMLTICFQVRLKMTFCQSQWGKLWYFCSLWEKQVFCRNHNSIIYHNKTCKCLVQQVKPASPMTLRFSKAEFSVPRYVWVCSCNEPQATQVKHTTVNDDKPSQFIDVCEAPTVALVSLSLSQRCDVHPLSSCSSVSHDSGMSDFFHGILITYLHCWLSWKLPKKSDSFSKLKTSFISISPICCQTSCENMWMFICQESLCKIKILCFIFLLSHITFQQILFKVPLIALIALAVLIPSRSFWIDAPMASLSSSSGVNDIWTCWHTRDHQSTGAPHVQRRLHWTEHCRATCCFQRTSEPLCDAGGLSDCQQSWVK